MQRLIKHFEFSAMLKKQCSTVILVLVFGFGNLLAQSDDTREKIKAKYSNKVERNLQLAAYDFLETAPDQEVRKIAEFLSPNSHRWQKNRYESQLKAKIFMETATDLTIKAQTVEKYPDNYRVQKYIYESQVAAKAYMKSVRNTDIAKKSEITFPNDYVKQRMNYNDVVYFSRSVLKEISPNLTVRRIAQAHNHEKGTPPLNLVNFHAGEYTLKFLSDGPVIMNRSLGPEMMRMCQRPVSESVDYKEFWEPTHSQITKMELHLVKYLSDRKAEGKHVPRDTYFDRQYIGVKSGDEKLIYGNYIRLMRGVTELGLPLYPSCAYHGAGGYWGILFDSMNNRFSEFRTNSIF